MGLKKLKGSFCGKLLVSLILGVTLGMGIFCLNRDMVYAEDINALYCSGNLYSETATFRIPDGITKIDRTNSERPIDEKKRVKKIIIPSSVTEIGEYAFSGFTELEEIIIPSSVTKIGHAAFCGCSSLKEITIPNNVKQIKTFAFRDCSSIEEITIPNSVETIECGAFKGCRSLKKVNLSSSTKVEASAFDDCGESIELSYPSDDPLAPFLNGRYLIKIMGTYHLV